MILAKSPGLGTPEVWFGPTGGTVACRPVRYRAPPGSTPHKFPQLEEILSQSNFVEHTHQSRRVRGAHFIRDHRIPCKEPYAEQARVVQLTMDDTNDLPQHTLRSPVHPVHFAHFVTPSLHPFVDESVGTRQSQVQVSHVITHEREKALC